MRERERGGGEGGKERKRGIDGLKVSDYEREREIESFLIMREREGWGGGGIESYLQGYLIMSQRERLVN